MQPEIIAGDIQEQRILVHNIVGELLLRVFVIGIRVEEQVIRRVVAVILNAEIAVSGIIEDVVPHLACGGLPFRSPETHTMGFHVDEQVVVDLDILQSRNTHPPGGRVLEHIVAEGDIVGMVIVRT